MYLTLDRREPSEMELLIKIKIYIWKHIEVNANEKFWITILISCKVDFWTKNHYMKKKEYLIMQKAMIASKVKRAVNSSTLITWQRFL